MVQCVFKGYESVFGVQKLGYKAFRGVNNQIVLVNDAAIPRTSLSLGENREKEVNLVPEKHNREDESHKRKRGEVEHNPVLSETAANESVSPLSPSQARTSIALKQTENATQEMTVQPFVLMMAYYNISFGMQESSEEGKRQRSARDCGLVLDSLEYEFKATSLTCDITI
ncbi:hypothetical protein Bca52824_042582 [Brassica carinata]|uniref:Uncharacterized protein n=1 Tax=Brassica carinata TaxID=52824 RepID=A0A8X7RV20_BRACI|nr:hypothetical protein Bca52824_042582 [Brassica carinata]